MTTFPFKRIALAVIIGLAVGLACLFLGLLLGSLNIAPASAVAGFLTAYAWAIGVLAGLWYFFTAA